MSEKKPQKTQTPDLPQDAEDWRPVTLIREPAQLPDMDLGNDEELESLSKAMEKEQERQLQDLAEQAQGLSEKEALDLAQQIAEDEALKQWLENEEKERESSDSDSPEIPQNLDLAEAQSCIEALLFMTDRPLKKSQIKDYLGDAISAQILDQALESAIELYQDTRHGFELVKVSGGYQFRTKPGRAWLAKKLAKVQTQRLSRGAMETLSIIAYKQPILKEEIDRVRGVDSSHFLRTLLDRKLIEIHGRSELPGRPMIYGTTAEFLSVFNLGSLEDLPPLREIEQMVPESQIDPQSEPPQIRRMRELVEQMKSDPERLAYDPEEDEKLLSEIRERVQSIPISVPTIEEQKQRDHEISD